MSGTVAPGSRASVVSAKVVLSVARASSYRQETLLPVTKAKAWRRNRASVVAVSSGNTATEKAPRPLSSARKRRPSFTQLAPAGKKSP
jgi:hypothetical protein